MSEPRIIFAANCPECGLPTYVPSDQLGAGEARCGICRTVVKRGARAWWRRIRVPARK